MSQEEFLESLKAASSLFSCRARAPPSEEAIREMLDSLALVQQHCNDADHKRRETIATIASTLETALSQFFKNSKESKSTDDGDDKKMEVDGDLRDDGNSRLDSFADGRRSAIESTIVSDLSSLPTLNDIAGLKEAKESLLEALVDPILYPEYFAKSNLQPWRCVLLYGPPGTGKSALCGAIAREVGARFYSISSSDLISSWSGQSEKLIRSLFDVALSKQEPSVIFMDEVDSLCRNRQNSEDDSSRRVKTELLVQLPRLQSSSSHVFLIAATNCPWELDPAFLRSNEHKIRFEKKIYIGLPDTEARAALFQKLLNKTLLSDEVTWGWLAEQTEGLSGDDLRRLATEIAFLQFRIYKEDKKRTGSSAVATPLSRELLSPVIQAAKPTVSAEYVRQFESYSDQKCFSS